MINHYSEPPVKLTTVSSHSDILIVHKFSLFKMFVGSFKSTSKKFGNQRNTFLSRRGEVFQNCVETFPVCQWIGYIALVGGKAGLKR